MMLSYKVYIPLLVTCLILGTTALPSSLRVSQRHFSDCHTTGDTDLFFQLLYPFFCTINVLKSLDARPFFTIDILAFLLI